MISISIRATPNLFSVSTPSSSRCSLRVNHRDFQEFLFEAMDALGTSPGICDVCKEPMDDPRLLPCFHSFCLKCLEKNHESPKCPTCKLDFQMPLGGLRNLKKNAFVEYLVSLTRLNVVCDSCKENKAVKFCIECAFNFCSSCLVHHERIPASRYHKLQPSRRLITNDKYPVHSEHSEGGALFCKDCTVVVCGQCLASKHKCHEKISVSDYLLSVKAKLEQNINKIQKMITNVETNYTSSEQMLSCNNTKASKLKKEIKERGKELKKAVDSYMAALLKHVDEELKQHQNQADDVMRALKNTKATLSARVETLRQRPNDLSYENLKYDDENIVERSTSAATANEIIPKYSENFCMSLSSGIDSKRLNLEKALGTLKKDPKFRFIKEVSLRSPYKTFAANGDEIFICDSDDSKIDVLGHDGSVRKSCFNLNDELSRATDLLLIDSKLYVAGRCCDRREVVKVVEVDTKSPCKPITICRLQHGDYFVRLTKSICGSLSVVLKNKIIHLTEDGKVTRTVTLASEVYDAVQLDDGRYVVCGPNEAVTVVNGDGEKVASCSPSRGDNPTTPFRLAKDVFGNIYVGDFNSVYVLDYNLNVMSRHIFDHSVYKMSYCREINALLVLTKKQKLFSFEL